jgi:hypothetical protein
MYYVPHTTALWAHCLRTLFEAKELLTLARDARAEEYITRRSAVQDARLECEMLRLEIEKHQRTHARADRPMGREVYSQERPASVTLTLSLRR